MFEIDTDAGEVRKAGGRIKLQSQPFKVLALLASRAGEVLTRQEIEQQIWGDQTHVDFELGLNYCIKQIRTALEDDAGKPRYVETLPRRGYRFIAAVEGHQRTRLAQSRQRPMLAVLPFGNLTGDAGQEYFADGLTEELISQLGKLNPQQLGVIAFTSAKQYKDTAKGIDQIGRELNVDFILEGSVRRTRDRVRIAAQLIQVSDQTHLWAEAYNRTLDDIITIQTDVGERVANSLALELIPGHQAAMTRASTRNSMAYDAYLRGRYYWNKRTEADFWKALKYFETAIEQDPHYAPAYVGLADVYNIIAFYSGLPPIEASEKSRAAVRKAVEIDSRLPEVYTAVAYARLLYEWDFSGAEEAFRHALELNPNQVTGHYWYALFLAAMERPDEALAHIQSAMQLDPLSLVINCHKGWVLYFARRYDDAILQLLNTIEMDQNFLLSRYFLGVVYLRTGRFADGIVQFEKAKETSNNHPGPQAGLSAALALSGKKSEARKILGSLEKLADRRYVAPYFIALVHLALGDVEEVFDWLEKAFKEHSAYLSNIKADPALDPIRSDPRFLKLIRRVGLPETASAGGSKQ